MGSQNYVAARRLEAVSYGQTVQQAYEEGMQFGYALAVEESYPELTTFCSAHRIFNSKCRICTWDDE